MKKHSNNFTCGMFIIACAIILAILVAVFTETAGAKSINQREWLLEYEQVFGYPVLAVELTTTYASGYPAPALEQTATAKPKKQASISSSVTNDMGYPAPDGTPKCYNPDELWQCQIMTPENRFTSTPNPGPGYPAPIPVITLTPRPTPTYAPTMDPDDMGYPAPFIEPIQTDTPGYPYPAP